MSHRGSVLFWFRRRRRRVAVVAAVTILALGLMQFVCPQPGAAPESASASAAAESTMSIASKPVRCGPQGCAYAGTGPAVQPLIPLPATPKPFVIAVLFFFAGVSAAALKPPMFARTPRRFAAYPPFLEPYRLRI